MGEIKYNGRSYSGLIQANGCFIDTDNIIASGSYIGNFSYTATQDCCVYTAMAMGNNTGCTMKIDGNDVAGGWNGVGTVISQGLPIFLKKGQTLTISSTYSATTSYFVYGIQQGSNITFLSEYASACYDTNEREVGCWVDGKPLYQKTALIQNISISANSDTNITLSNYFADVDTPISYECCESSGRFILPSILASDYLRPYSVGITVEKSADHIIFTRGSGSSTTISVYFTLRYTKTTDTAGSGQFAPTGMPTHHYSTNEQVVGTWINGKPLYETTFSFTISSAHSTVYQTGIANIDRIVNLQGQVDRGDGWFMSVNFSRWDTSSADLIGAMMNKDGRANIFVNDSFYYGLTVYMTIQYTKTTD